MESNPYHLDTKLHIAFNPSQFTEMENAFKAIDKNRDGKIDRSELLTTLHSQGQRHLTEDDVANMISTLDINKDGCIQFSEYALIMKDVYNNKSANIEGKKNKQGKGIFVVGESASSFSTFSEEERTAYVKVINTVLKDDADCQKYLPIDPDSMDIFPVMKDGIILCKLINCVQKGVIDERTINKKQNMNIYLMTENLNLAISSSKAIGCQVIGINYQTIIEQRIAHILGLLWQIIRLILLRSVNLKSHPQLIRLLKDGEQLSDLLKLHPEDLLLRWFNFHLTNAGHPDKITNFSSDLKNSDKYLVLLNQLNKQCDLSAMKESDLTKKADSVLSNARKINVESYIKPKDIVEGNQKLNVIFTAAIFNECHGLDPVTEEEAYEAAKLLEDDDEGSREERSFRLWMNSLNIPDVYFNNLYEDCKDGNLLLKVIDKVSPGSVNWKQVDENPNNKFKKVGNCNVAVDSMKKGGFKAVGIGGMDIHNGNKKMILGLIWQLMRSHSLQIIGGKTEEEMVAWGNSVSGSNVTSLRDKTLKDSLWFIKIMNGIESRAINWDLVNQGEELTSEQIENNAKYAISISRKLGATVFLVWEDIRDLKIKMLTTFLAAIMDVYNLEFALKKEKNKIVQEEQQA